MGKVLVSFDLCSDSYLRSVIPLGSLCRQEPWVSSPKISVTAPGISLVHWRNLRLLHTAPAATSKQWDLDVMNLALGNLRNSFHLRLDFGQSQLSVWCSALPKEGLGIVSCQQQPNPMCCRILMYFVNTRKLDYIRSFQIKQGCFLDFVLYLIFRLWQ